MKWVDSKGRFRRSMNQFVCHCVVVFLVLASRGATSRAAQYIVNPADPAATDESGERAFHSFKTISAAVKNLVAGDTLIIKAGVYRESVLVDRSGSADQPITIAAAPGEIVVLNGGDLVKGWASESKDSAVWLVRPWNQWADYGTNEDDISRAPQLIYDNMLMTHVASRDKMIPGSFFYAPENNGTIYFWPLPPKSGAQITKAGSQWWEEPANLASENPNDHKVEVVVRPYGIKVADKRSHIIISGLIVRYGCGGYPGGAGIELGSDSDYSGRVSDVTVQDCVSEFQAGGGLNARGHNITIRRSYFHDNGINSHGMLTSSLIEDCIFDHNSLRGIEHSRTAGGIHLLQTANVVVRRCQFINNDGPGLWFDWGTSGNIVEQCFSSFNSGSGIMVEVSPHFDSAKPDARAVVDESLAQELGVPKGSAPPPTIVRNNVCVGNRWDGTQGAGILLQMGSNTVVINNTLVGNAEGGVFVRYHPYDTAGHRCVDNQILNNLFVDNGGEQISITPDPQDKPGFVSRNRSDYNLFWDNSAWLNRDESTQKKERGWDRSSFARWGKTQGIRTWSVEEWGKIRGFDAHSIQWDPMFVSPSVLDFRLQPGSPASHAGYASKYVTDDFLGRLRPGDEPPSIGALEFFNDRPVPTAMPMR